MRKRKEKMQVFVLSHFTFFVAKICTSENFPLCAYAVSRSCMHAQNLRVSSPDHRTGAQWAELREFAELYCIAGIYIYACKYVRWLVGFAVSVSPPVHKHVQKPARRAQTRPVAAVGGGPHEAHLPWIHVQTRTQPLGLQPSILRTLQDDTGLLR